MRDNIKNLFCEKQEFRKIEQYCSAMGELIRQNEPATLPDLVQAGNFIYEIHSPTLTRELASQLNALVPSSSVRSRLETLLLHGGSLKFATHEHTTFLNNMILEDSLLPNILAGILVQFYTSGVSAVRELTQALSKVNPIGYDANFPYDFYEHKIKNFLVDVALGMCATTAWDGCFATTGGYLLLKDSEQTSECELYSRDQFGDHLFQHCLLDTASCARYHFGKIEEKEGRFYFSLNLQIRFR